MVDAVEIQRLVSDWEQDKKFDLVCQGGGVLGIGLVGAYSVLEASGFHVQNIAGTSAGAVVCSLIAAGYTAAEIYDIVFNQIDFAKLTDPTPELRLPLVGPLVSELVEHGLYKGDFFLHVLTKLLAAKGIDTFRDLIYDAHEPVGSPYRYKLQVIAADLTDRSLLRLPQDIANFQHEPDDLSVALAVRMSMSIPFFFHPVYLRDNANRTHVIVDGGMLSNFPIWIFDSQGLPEWPTIGIKFTVPDQNIDIGRGLLPGPVGQTVDMGIAFVETAMQFFDRMTLRSDAFARTVLVPTTDAAGAPISATNFTLTAQEKQKLFANGQDAAVAFLNSKWTFPGYIAAFRSGAATPQATDRIRETMEAAARTAGLPTVNVQAVKPTLP